MLSIDFLTLGQSDLLEITLGSSSYPIDLYCYCSDNTFLNEETSLAKGLLNFISMLDNWCAKVESLKIGQSDFLPFDYADQSISFLLVLRQSESDVSVQAAFTTEFLGWGTNPSQLYVYNFLSKSYRLDGEEYVMSISQLIDSVNRSRSLIMRNLYAKPN